jgi:hypothetical protein
VRWPDRKAFLRRLLGARRFGALHYALRPGRRMAWGGPFNGQAYRCLLFAALVERLRPAAIVETGTYLGTTTEWMASFQLPVFTCDSSKETFWFAKARLSEIPNVMARLGDSQDFLSNLLRGSSLDAGQDRFLFYLDAHWGRDLPLLAEIDLIFSLCPTATVLIDDFEVPDDPGYGFDAYGPGATLNASYIDPSVRMHGLVTLYPATPSSVETGMRRGCVILCKDRGIAEALRGISLLRRAQEGTTASAIADDHAHAR